MLYVTHHLFMGQWGLETNCFGLILGIFGKICSVSNIILVTVKEHRKQNSIKYMQRKCSKWLSRPQLNQNVKVKITGNTFI